MAKIVLDTITGGYDLSIINNNFDKIEAALQDEVLYRDNPVGEPNTLETDIDVNTKRLYNLPEPLLDSQAARLKDVQNAIAGGAANLIEFTPYGHLASTNIQAAIQEHVDDLASVSPGLGASLIGVQDTDGYFTGSEVESVAKQLAEFTQIGTGAVLRTQDSKLKDLVSVFDFMTTAEIAATQDAAQTAVNHRTAILAALAAHKRIFFPKGTYYLGNVGNNEVVFNMVGKGDDIVLATDSSVEFRCTSAHTDPDESFTGTIFRFETNNNVHLGVMRFYDYGRTQVDRDDSSRVRGISAIDIAGTGVEFKNIIIDGIIGYNLIACARVFSIDAFVGTRFKSIKIGFIFSNDCYYGYNGQNNGDEVTIGVIYGYKNYRCYFVYGVSTHKVRVVSDFNRATSGVVNISRIDTGPQTDGISVEYVCRNIATAVNHVLINHVGPGTGIILDIKVDLDIVDNSGLSNIPVKFVTYTAVGGIETGSSLANTVANIKITGQAHGCASITCTAAYNVKNYIQCENHAVLRFDTTIPTQFRFTQSVSYTPTWTAASVNPTLGNGTLSGAYIIEGGFCYFTMSLGIGSTTTTGTGNWIFTLPFASRLKTQGTAKLFDAGTANFIGMAEVSLDGSTFTVVTDGGGAFVGPSAPFVWTTSDSLFVNLVFPI